MNFIARPRILVAAGLGAALLAAGSAAQAHVWFSVDVPAPVYTVPQPVYVQPQPTYAPQGPVYVGPAQPVYAAPADPEWQREAWRHRYWEHRRWEHRQWERRHHRDWDGDDD